MKLGVVVEGDLARMMRESVDVLSQVASDAVDKAARGLQANLRAQVQGGKLARKNASLVQAVQVRVFPPKRPSLGAAGWVFSKAVRIHEAFTRDRTIVARSGRFLVIPLEGAYRLGLATRPAWGGSKPRKWSQLGGLDGVKGVARIRLADGSILIGIRRGDAVEKVFLLRRQVHLTARLDFDRPAQKALADLHADLASKLGG